MIANSYRQRHALTGRYVSRYYRRKDLLANAEPDPTPEEIKARVAKIREGWSPEERARRRVGGRVYSSIFQSTTLNRRDYL